MDLGLDGRVIIATGATSGLGRATAAALTAEGARLVVCSRDPDRVAATVAELGADRAVGVVADLVDDDTPARLVAAAHDAFGRLDGLFVSHGGPPAGPAAELSDDDLDRALALAARAPIRVVRDVTAELGEGGAVLVLTSTSSVEPIAGLASSNLTRTSVWGYCRTLADEVAPRGVRVNLVLPGRFATDRLAELHASVADRTGRTPDEVRDAAAAAIPLRRIGDPAELGRVAAFLLSPAASYVTGCAWRVDGGAVTGL